MAVSPDSRFICSSDIDSYFVNKLTGAPLSNGKVYFYQDENRTVLKPVYQLSGSPPNYSFSVLPNPLDLSIVGTYDYLGNNIAIYYFPYEGTPDDSDGTLQLYYVTVEDEDGLEQLVRDAWPPNIADGITPGGNEGSRNFIPNGQFLTHTQIVGTSTPPVESIGSVDIQYIAQGGWSFRRTTGGASQFNNSFSELSGSVAGLNDFPRNAFNFICTSFSAGDQVRDLCIEWEDTNKFSAGNPEGSQSYTYFFAAESLDSNSYTFDVRLIRNFGTGGTPSPYTDESIGTVVITPSYSYYNINIASIPEAAGSYGTNGDDYILIALRGPNSSWAIQVTDFGFFPGTQQLDVYPTQTDGDMITRSIFGWTDIPEYDATNLYLPAVLTPKGMKWDDSQIGKYEEWSYIWDYGTYGAVNPDTNVILCNGSSYFADEYSPLGIPYARLQSKIIDTGTNLPIYGTGLDFVTGYTPSASTALFYLVTNQEGAQTNTANGATSTGFTFSTPITGNDTYGINANVVELGNTVYTYDLLAGAVTNSANTGTSGLTVVQSVNAPNMHARFLVGVSILPSAGTYFTFDTVSLGACYAWFTVNGVGVNPAVGGTAIVVPLLSTFTVNDTAAAIRNALAGFQVSYVTAVAASGMTAGSYFTFHSDGNAYIPWYKIAGAGTEPGTTGRKILVTLSGAETALQVAQATINAVNYTKFAVPNMKAVIKRSLNLGDLKIPSDSAYEQRFTFNNNFDSSSYGLGSYEYQEIEQHRHVYEKVTNVIRGVNVAPVDAFVPGDFDGVPNFENADTSIIPSVGGAEVRPFNMYVNTVIRY